MNIFEAILTRRSWRTYNGLRLDENTISQVESIISAANAAASEPLTRDAAVPAPRVVLLEDESLNGLSGTYGAIRGARHFMALISTSSEGAQIDAGALMENIIISLTAIGLDTCWLGGTFSRSRFGAAAALADGEEILAVSPVGHRSPSTRFAERMMQRLARSSRREPFQELFSGVNTPDLSAITRPSDSMTDRERISIILDMVRHAPSSSNSQPWRAAVSPDGRKVRLYSTRHSRYSLLDMGIALDHFLESAAMLGQNWEARLDDAAPDITINLQLD